MKITSITVVGPLLFAALPAAAATCDLSIGAGTASPNLSSVRWPSHGTVCINPGNYDNKLVVFDTHRSLSAPLVIRAKDPLNPPVLRQGAVIRNSSYVELSEVNAADPKGYAAILVDQGSHHVTIDHVKAHDAPFGVVVGSARQADGFGGPAGPGNVIKNSETGTNIRYSGIAVQDSGGPVSVHEPDYPYATTIIGNEVSGNGGHAISIENSKFVKIESNRVFTNSYGGGGYSGVHLYATGDNGKCGRNLVRYNFVSDTQMKALDIAASDGNGIIADTFCDANDISFNVVSGNYGNGISIFTSADNKIYNNTIYGNTRQPNRTSLFPPMWNPLAEISISTCAAVNQVTGASDCGGSKVYPDRAHGNEVFNNIVHPVVYGVPGVRVMPPSTSANLNNRIGPNLYWVGADVADRPSANWAPVYFGGWTTEFSVASIEARTGTTGNLEERPIYDKEQHPGLSGAEAFRLARRPSGTGKPLATAVKDMAGALPAAGASNFGAYYCNASTTGAACGR